MESENLLGVKSWCKKMQTTVPFTEKQFFLLYLIQSVFTFSCSYNNIMNKSPKDWIIYG